MLESVFAKYDKIIQPQKRILPTNKDQLKLEKLDINSTVQSTVSRDGCKRGLTEGNCDMITSPGGKGNATVGIADPEEVKSLYFSERKKNLIYRHEINSLRVKVEQMQEEIREKDNLISRLKFKGEKDTNYLLNLEKMIMKMKYNNPTSPPEGRSRANTKQKKSPLENNEVNTNNEDVSQMKNELAKLRSFKEEVYKISKNTDEINANVLNLIVAIEEMFYNINKTYSESEIKIPLHDNFYEEKYSTFNEIREKINGIFKSINEIGKNKNEEYAYLLNVKEEETELLIKEIEKLRKEKDEILAQSEEKNKIINTLRVENEFIKMRDSVKFDEMEQKKDEERKRAKDLKEKKIVDRKINEMKRSVNGSVVKIKRNFDMKDPKNMELINNLKEKINS